MPFGNLVLESESGGLENGIGKGLGKARPSEPETLSSQNSPESLLFVARSGGEAI